MNCKHFWLPHHGRLFRYVMCGRCLERRRVRWAPRNDRLDAAAALGEAVERGVIPATEAVWQGRQVR